MPLSHIPDAPLEEVSEVMRDFGLDGILGAGLFISQPAPYKVSRQPHYVAVVDVQQCPVDVRIRPDNCPRVDS